MPLDLRPLTLGELLDRSFGLFRRHFWLFVGLMALPSVLVVLLNLAMLLFPEFIKTAETAPEGPSPAMLGAFILVGLLILVLLIGYMVTYMVTLGATTVAVSELYLDRTATIASAYGHVRGHIGRLTLLMILIALRLIGLFILSMVPISILAIAIGVMSGPLGATIAGAIAILGTFAAMFGTFLYSLRYAVAVPALVLEPITANQAIRRSVALIRENYWRTAILVIFAMVITYAALILFQMPFMVGAYQAGPESSTAFWLNLLGSISGAIGGALTGPLMIVALALLYYDLRIRKEGLDLQIMMASLDQHAPPASGPLTSAG
jgi:hypothetical protein